MLDRKDMLVTSGFNFEGYRITKYLGFFSGETALGTGMFSEFFAGAADFFGTTSNKFADKLETAKNYAISALQEKVRNAGANAIIGLDVDYNMFMSNLIGVIANGTAVCVESLEGASEGAAEAEDEQLLPVLPADLDAELRPTLLRVTRDTAALEMTLYAGQAPRAVLAEVAVKSAFGVETDLGQVAFMEIRAREESDRSFISAPTRLEKPLPPAAALARVRIIGRMETSEVGSLKQLRAKYGPDAVCEPTRDESGWQCVCGRRNAPESAVCSLCGRPADPNGTTLTWEIVAEAEKLPSAAAIFQYISGLNLAETEANLKALGTLRDAAKMERIYGNCKGSSLRALKAALPRE